MKISPGCAWSFFIRSRSSYNAEYLFPPITGSCRSPPSPQSPPRFHGAPTPIPSLPPSRPGAQINTSRLNPIRGIPVSVRAVRCRRLHSDDISNALPRPGERTLPRIGPRCSPPSRSPFHPLVVPRPSFSDPRVHRDNSGPLPGWH